jgi:hypothetical protein
VDFLPTTFADLAQFSEGSVSAKQLGKTCGIRQIFADERCIPVQPTTPDLSALHWSNSRYERTVTSPGA